MNTWEFDIHGYSRTLEIYRNHLLNDCIVSVCTYICAVLESLLQCDMRVVAYAINESH